MVNLFDFSKGLINTAVNPLNFPLDAFVAGENIDLKYRVLSTRPGRSAALTVDDVGTTVEWLGQVRFPTQQYTYLLAQIRDATTCKLYASPTNLPSSSLAFTEIYNLGTSAKTIDVSVLNDRAIITTGATGPLVFSGCLTNEGPGDWAVPKQIFGTLDTGTSYFSMTEELCDPDVDTEVHINAFPVTTGYIYICLEQAITDGLYFEVADANSTASIMAVERYTNSTWTAITKSDGTATAGATLAKSGSVTWTAVATDYQTIAEVPGYWLRVSVSATLDAAVSLTRVLFSAPCQLLRNIGQSASEKILAFLYNDVSLNNIKDWTVEVNDNDLNSFARLDDGNANAETGMGTGDAIYIGSLWKFNAIEIEPERTYNQQAAATMTVKYWTGIAWAAVSNMVDGTLNSGGTITLAKKGIVSFTLPSDWHRSKGPNNQYDMGYWVQITVSGNLTARTYIAEVRTRPVMEDLKKYSYTATFRDRAALVNRPDATDQADVSAAFMEYVWTGEDSKSQRTGGQDAVTGVQAMFNQLWISKTEEWYLLNGYNPKTFAMERAEVSQQTPINNQCVIPGPIQAEDGARQGLYFLNVSGAWVFDGLKIQSISQGRVNWFDPSVDNPRIDLDYLYGSCGVYWPERGWIIWGVPMITGNDSSQSTNNYLIIWDLFLQTWLAPYDLPAASLCTARHYSASAPGHLGQLGLYCGDYLGNVWRLFDPAASVSTVAAWIETGWMSFDAPYTEKLIRNIWAYGKTTGNLVIKIYIDGSTTEAATKRVTLTGLAGLTDKDFDSTFKGPNITGHFFKLRFEWTGAGDIYGVQFNQQDVRPEQRIE